MTLFIACLLIYNFGMEWWWYGIAAAIWGIRARVVFVASDMKIERHLYELTQGVKDSRRRLGYLSHIVDGIERDVRNADDARQHKGR